jgi:hypothetical protein
MTTYDQWRATDDAANDADVRETPEQARANDHAAGLHVGRYVRDCRDCDELRHELAAEGPEPYFETLDPDIDW